MTAPVSVDAAAMHRAATLSLSTLADRCVQCGLCLPHCPTYQLDRSEPESPRGRIAYIKAVADGTISPSAAGDRHLDHCLGCRRCESACPAGVAFGALLVAARAAQFQRSRPAARLRLTAWLLTRPRLLSLLLEPYRWLYPFMPARWRVLPRPSRHCVPTQSITQDAAMTVFLGCVARRYEQPTRHALSLLLSAINVQVLEASGQTCCGTASEHLGDTRALVSLDASNRQAFAEHPQVLCLASGCRERLSRSLSGISTVSDPLPLLAAHRQQLRFRSSQRRIAVHSPCSQRDSLAITQLLACIPGLTAIPLPDHGCCGAAGLHQLAEPERAAALRQPLVAAIAALAVAEVLSTNIGCRLHLAQALSIPVRHPLDFLAEHLL